MDSSRRSAVVPGIILILVGLVFLAFELVPGLGDRFAIEFTWPLIIVGIGALLLILGIAFNEPGMAIPAAITGGTGLLLWYQNTTGDWGSWAYAWTLIPGFIGLGLVLYALWGQKGGDELQAGAVMVLISALLFMIFGAFLGPFDVLGRFWPVILVLLGFYLLYSGLIRRR